ncbi:RAMP superfamily CRISPR-associated protein [Candidatus Venteria ishoeyi]|uniref:RAMP superfamily CRISPR-associated protein n=1 Tax=Candidatus Venteria ishoeyi TaxID=1899563 RepID=UPI0025A5555F|nr:RAMP superfamily CRISPR-associated protein [Candidatus Venteria ishoeyi]MDM8545495.1 RAMP superfamily CRISPR-associated protein [Candidatus Venteria ishoeyi]
MIASKPCFHIAQLVLETLTPLSIATGRGDGLFDNLLVRDANGLPAIPGSSLAGVLRHLYQQVYTETSANELFGKAKDKNDERELASTVQVSWGVLHNQDNQPVEKFDPNLATLTDSVLKDALGQGISRDQVRINHQGVAASDEQGKFDRTSLRTGHRFSVELSFWRGSDQDPKPWQQLLTLLQHPEFRLGGNTRSGLGKVKLIQCQETCFDLSTEQGFDDFSALARHLNSLDTETTLPALNTDSSAVTTYQLKLKPLEPFRFGGGKRSLNPASEADDVPVLEQKISWTEDKGTLDTKRYVLVPASSIKGAISHRTAFHYNRLKQVFCEEIESDNYACHVGENNEAVKALFGYAKDSNDQDKEKGRRGIVLFDDLYLDIDSRKAGDLIHNSIDRFTGGVLNGALFVEEIINDPNIKLKLDISLLQTIEDEDILKAFELSLDDLKNSRLALGAGSGRSGWGYFCAVTD